MKSSVLVSKAFPKYALPCISSVVLSIVLLALAPTQVKKLLALTMLLLAAWGIQAQMPPACPSNDTPAADLCSDICIYCNFNGYMGSTAGYTGQAPPGFCDIIENEQWLGFIAGSPAGTFTATPSNCANGNGIQIALYTNCSSSPIGCNEGIAGGGITPVSITAALTTGVNYFLLIDGYDGDQCDFTITVFPPTVVQAPNVGPTGNISGPITVCSSATVTYSIPTVSGAGYYTWTGPLGSLINGEPPPVTLAAPSGNIVQITMGPNSGQVCVTPANSCNDGEPKCINVNVQPIPPTVLPPVVVCNEDLPYELPWGDFAYNSGLYETTFVSYQGCDSVVRKQVIVEAAICQCAGYQIDVPDVCTCNDPSGYTAVTIKVTAAAGQNWTVKAQNGLYNPMNTAALIAIGAPLTDIGGGMYTLDAKRKNAAGYWIQVTNAGCDLDIMVGNPDPCAVPDVCDGVDNDCDNEVDEDAPTWYADTDSDGYGDPNNSTQACDQPSGYVADNTDCNDGDGDVNPGATEIPNNGKDDDCDPNTPDCPEIPDLLLVTLPDGSCLYVHPTDNSTSIQWGGYGTDIPTLANIIAANADFDGAGNTQKIVDALGAGTYAAKLCADLVYNGYDDWYLPAAGELKAMYDQLGPGGNNGLNDFYWSSSEYNNVNAWLQLFGNGTQNGVNKGYDFRCRCVRR